MDYCRLYVCIVGGLTEARKIPRWCETHYVPLAPHNPLGPVCTAASLHLCLATSLHGGQELSREPGQILPDVFPRQVPFADGHLLPPEVPGLGVEIDEEAAGTHPAAHEGGLQEVVIAGRMAASPTGDHTRSSTPALVSLPGHIAGDGAPRLHHLLRVTDAFNGGVSLEGFGQHQINNPSTLHLIRIKLPSRHQHDHRIQATILGRCGAFQTRAVTATETIDLDTAPGAGVHSKVECAERMDLYGGHLLGLGRDYSQPSTSDDPLPDDDPSSFDDRRLHEVLNLQKNRGFQRESSTQDRSSAQDHVTFYVDEIL